MATKTKETDKETTENRDGRDAFEADKARREAAGVPYKIAEQLARRQQEVNNSKKAENK